MNFLSGFFPKKKKKKVKRFDLIRTNGYRLIGASLENTGNSCYVNAVLQCLTHTVPLVETLSSYDHSCSCDADEFCCFCTLKVHVDFCLRASGYSITPRLIVDNLSKISPYFVPDQEQDAHEFLCCLLDKLNQSFNYENSPINQIFGGRIKSQVLCCNCAHVTDTYEPIMDLSLEIDNEETCTLIDALKSFTKVEKLDDPDNKFSCEGCRDEVCVEKQIKLFEAPQVLSINFKRFKIHSSGIYKIDKFVEYPLQLDLRLFLSSPENEVQYSYELYAVIVHVRNHYYSVVRSSENVWHIINDEEVFRCPEDMVLNRQAYILFYIKQESSPWFISVLERMLRVRSPFERRPLEDTDAITKISEKEINDERTEGVAASNIEVSSDENLRLKESSKDEENRHKKTEEGNQNDEGSILSKKRGRAQYENETTDAITKISEKEINDQTTEGAVERNREVSRDENLRLEGSSKDEENSHKETEEENQTDERSNHIKEEGKRSK